MYKVVKILENKPECETVDEVTHFSVNKEIDEENLPGAGGGHTWLSP
jgi:hypothetical protein